MGRSAKLHKRVNKKKLPGGQSGSKSNAVTGTSTQIQAQAAKKKVGLNDKVSAGTSAKAEGPILGGADYVSLLMGGRRRARQEAAKLPVGEQR